VKENLAELIVENGQLWLLYTELKAEWFDPSLMFRRKKRNKLKIAIEEASQDIIKNYENMTTQVLRV